MARSWRDEIDELLQRDEFDANSPEQVWRNTYDLGCILTGFMFSLGIPNSTPFELEPSGRASELGLYGEPRQRLATAAALVAGLRGWEATNAEGSGDYDALLLDLLDGVAHPICIALQENQADEPTQSILRDLVALSAAIVATLDPEPEGGDDA